MLNRPDRGKRTKEVRSARMSHDSPSLISHLSGL
jgi:hypothetical protein